MLYKPWISSRQLWTFSSLSPSPHLLLSFTLTLFFAISVILRTAMSQGPGMLDCNEMRDWKWMELLVYDLFFICSVTCSCGCHLLLGNPATSFDHSGATDTTDSAKWVDLQHRGLWWPEFDGLSLLSCSEMENSVEQHIYDQTAPHYTATP